MSWYHNILWRFIYPSLSPVLYHFLRIIGSNKVKKWSASRSNSLKNNVTEKAPGQRHILFFCPSLGEYESIKMIIHRFKMDQTFTEVTFFSLSGYNGISPKDKFVDKVSLSPVDTKKAVDQFFSVRHIDEVFISSLALWPAFLNYLIKKKIPYHFIGGMARQGLGKHIYYQTMGGYLKRAANIITIDKASQDLFSRLKIPAKCAGDPRIDSIIYDLSQPSPTAIKISERLQNRHIVIFGSTHIEDEKIVIPLLNKWNHDKNSFAIVSPHEIERAPLLEAQISNSQLLSNSQEFDTSKILIVDQLGLLKHLYCIADVSFIGGGLTAKVHNVLEPLVAGSIPCFGPYHQNSPIAVKWSKMIPGAIIKNTVNLRSIISMQAEPQNKLQFEKIRTQILFESEGVSDAIYDAIKPKN